MMYVLQIKQIHSHQGKQQFANYLNSDFCGRLKLILVEEMHHTVAEPGGGFSSPTSSITGPGSTRWDLGPGRERPNGLYPIPSFLSLNCLISE